MKSAHAPSRAFTLIELLVVITIIVILAALAMSAYGKSRRSSERTTALAKMRQLAMAIQMYSADNEGYLPCRTGMLTGQSPRYNSDTGSGGLTNTLAYQLYKYLGLSKPVTAFQYATPLSHPAYERHLVATSQWDSTGKWTKSISPSYILNKTVVNQDASTTIYPWGDSTDNRPSIPSVAVNDLGGASKLWALQDVDQKNIKAINGNLPGWYSLLPKTAVLDTVRNVLFFDGHIEAVSADYVQLQSGKTKL